MCLNSFCQINSNYCKWLDRTLPGSVPSPIQEEKKHLEDPWFKAGSTVEKVIKPGYWLQHKMKAGIGPLGQLNCLCLNQIFSTGKQHVIRLF